jgi:hypothetical protein
MPLTIAAPFHLDVPLDAQETAETATAGSVDAFASGLQAAILSALTDLATSTGVVPDVLTVEVPTVTYNADQPLSVDGLVSLVVETKTLQHAEHVATNLNPPEPGSAGRFILGVTQAVMAGIGAAVAATGVVPEFDTFSFPFTLSAGSRGVYHPAPLV